MEFHIGDGYLCPALSKAVKTKRKGEKAELAYFSNKYICGRYHYRTSERFRQSHYEFMTMKKGEHAAVTVDTEYLRGGDDASCKFLASL